MRAILSFILLAALATATLRARGSPIEDDREKDAHEKDLQSHPDSAPAHFAYAEFLADHNDWRGAIVQWRIAQLLDPEDAAIANSLGGAYLRAGRAVESARAFQRAVAIANEVAAYHYNLANVEYILRRDLSAAWKIAPDEVLQRAIEQYREASELSPNDMEYARGYAESFYGLPNPDWAQAEAAWRHVLEISPQRNFAYLQLARVSLKRGEKLQALSFLDQMSDTKGDGLIRKLRDQALMP